MIKPLNEYEEDELHLLRQSSSAAGQYLEYLKKHPEKFEDILKHQRIKAWLESSLATLLDNSSTQDICLYWSDKADQILIQACQKLKFDELGLGLFALGKLGAQELNLSSDVDLIIVSKDVYTPEMLKAARSFVQIVSPSFRVDLDLRPGGPGSPLVSTLNRFQDYYWTQSDLWERMALVRLRPIAGELSLLAEVLTARDQFCYRKYLDYSLLEELKRLRPKIHKTAPTASSSKVNLKLTPGFIRDIELFINAHQIIYGGKEPQLRTHSTHQAARSLAQIEKSPELFKTLLEYYWLYRKWENQTQAINDFHTHSFDPINPPSGWKWPSKSVLESMSSFVDENISGLLGQVQKTKESIAHESGRFSEKRLELLGFSKESIDDVWPEVKKASVLSRQKDIDEIKRVEVIEKFIEELSRSAFDKDLGLKGLRDFLSSIRAKATFFHLLSKEHKLIKDLSFLFGLSPYLGSLFSNRPELIDSFILNRDEPFSHDIEVALVQMAERKRIAEIRSALAFLAHLRLDSLTHTLTQTADDIATHLLDLIQSEVNPKKKIYLLALGKWGGRELGFKSDLDFIFVSKDAPEEKHHRIVRRFISHLRDPSASGIIYNIDTRLRPSGKGGALIVQEEQLYEFLEERASSWERQAYLKARWIGQPKIFKTHFHVARGLSSSEINELKEIRNKLIIPFRSNAISIKHSRGGIVDIELALQTLILKQKIEPISSSTEDFFRTLKMEDHFLFRHYFLLRRLEQISRILSTEVDPLISIEKRFTLRAARILEKEPQELLREIEDGMNEASKYLAEIDPSY